ncbi:unnamed protein product [Pocillopora meandrina]|uniref:Uncharacterized protein n=1 Tax=Pocillopora meandrina TaxID=46732 RepID=A0AAU9X1F1_9CNID|nr:unnamed protein product [Pocillopora meandrina]
MPTHKLRPPTCIPMNIYKRKFWSLTSLTHLLNTQEIALLSKGPKFCLAPTVNKHTSKSTNITSEFALQSRKLEQDLKPREIKPPIINQQCVVYSLTCDVQFR